MNDRQGKPFELPFDLLSKGRVLAGETAWPPEIIPEVIARLGDYGLAVVGVELWREERGLPVWIASSNYRCERGTSWEEHVKCCTTGALEFIQRFGKEQGAIFNLTWRGEDEL